MTIKTLYRFVRSDGGVTVTPNVPEQDYTTLFCLIADEGKILTRDYISFHKNIDVESSDGWIEVDYDEDSGKVISSVSTGILEKAQAYDIIMGVSE